MLEDNEVMVDLGGGEPAKVYRVTEGPTPDENFIVVGNNKVKVVLTAEFEGGWEVEVTDEATGQIVAYLMRRPEGVDINYPENMGGVVWREHLIGFAG